MVKNTYMAPTTELLRVNAEQMVCASVTLDVSNDTPETDGDGNIWIGSRSKSVWDDEEEEID